MESRRSCWLVSTGGFIAWDGCSGCCCSVSAVVGASVSISVIVSVFILVVVRACRLWGWLMDRSVDERLRELVLGSAGGCVRECKDEGPSPEQESCKRPSSVPTNQKKRLWL